jgi:tRNA A-37 threonylcarbamoyl transferase component Bud32
MTVLEVLPFSSVGAAGSTPINLTVKGTPNVELFGKLYSTSHMRSDRWYKLGRMVMYGSLEDERPFNSVRRLTEYEDYILRYLQDYGIPSAGPYGVVELMPEREYLIVTEFLEGSREILDPEVSIDRETAASGLSIVRSLWKAGLAHRDIKPSNLLVRENRAYLIDAAFCEVRPTSWRQAVDLANMMLVLGLRLDPEIVYQEAVRTFSEKEIGEAFAATTA